MNGFTDPYSSRGVGGFLSGASVARGDQRGSVAGRYRWQLIEPHGSYYDSGPRYVKILDETPVAQPTTEESRSPDLAR